MEQEPARDIGYDRYGPYGYLGDDVGQGAIEVLAGLSEEVPDFRISDASSPVWSNSDAWTFSNLTELESGIPLIEPHPSVDRGEIGDLHRAFARFHVSLPLSEAERRRLFDPINRGDVPDIDVCRPLNLLDVREEIVSAGVKHVIDGRDILRRMAAWRRETDEFANQGTLDEAREALGVIATTLVADKHWPREHWGMRAELLGAE